MSWKHVAPRFKKRMTARHMRLRALTEWPEPDELTILLPRLDRPPKPPRARAPRL